MTKNHDPLAHASAIPNIAALIDECELIQQDGMSSLGGIAIAEDTQFNRRSGKSNPPDGKRWQKNAKPSEIVRPYDGAPDSDVHLTDELVLGEVDILMMAAEMAQPRATSVNLSKANASDMAELMAVAAWCGKASADDMRDDLELAAQMTAKLGWSVLNPGWLERWELVERTLDMESFVVEVAQGFGPEAAQALQISILDPTLEAQAIEAVQQLFAWIPKARTKTIVRELRENGTTTFLDRQQGEKRPTLRTLIQGLNYFVMGRASKLSKARGHLVIEMYSQADFENTAASNNWNEEFVERAIASMGKYSTLADGLREQASTDNYETGERYIEIWTTTVYQFDETIKAGGNYFTVFCPHVKPTGEESAEGDYATHALLAYACGAPFVQSRRMVEGPGMEDSRGVAEMVRGDQAIIKMLQDAIVARGHLEVDPPRAFMGFGGTKVEGWNKPGGMVTSLMPGADVKELGPTRGSPQVGELAIARVESGARRRFALPNTTDGSHPSAWQMRQARIVKRFLSALAEARTQQVVLCYQNLEPWELAEIIGRPPTLTLEDVLKHRVTLSFDVRGLDPDWRTDLITTVGTLMGMDKGGSIDSNKTVQLLGAVFDPTLIGEITRDEAGASAATYRKVMNDISDIMDGNPPPMVEMDASAGMQLKMAMQIIGQNERWQQQLQQDQKAAESLKTYVKNLQHSEQETNISPQQGRLGVAQMPQRPVQKGMATQSPE
jgi:hypothetical protein